MRTALILEEAAEEAVEAIAWYESECPGLGLEFAEAIHQAITAIEEDIIPLAPLPLVSARLDAKRLLLQKFPYDIVTIERDGNIIVVAIAHQTRKPGYWRKRVNSAHV